jgi:7-keto-8-aminopelargonate synthetase-like enzyme
MPKSRTNKFIDTIDECLTNGVNNGIFQVSLENDTFNGRNVTIGGQTVVNFGSCSYLGLEVDERLKQGAIDATIKYGVQYSSSRLFSACGLYEEFEDLLGNIFGHPAIMAPSTTLSHLGALPTIIQDEDLIILDHQVHGSVQLAVQVVKARGTKIEMIRHNNMQMLEDVIKENPNKYNKIWYMADGLYSMYGDFAPMRDIAALLEKYGNFHVYIDDAHAMSWTGKHGAGYVLSQMPLHPKMVIATSLSKGFGAAGGATILPDPEMKRKILTCGSSYTFSGPEHPPMLGACIASAKIHLSDDIYRLQHSLQERIQLAKSIIENYKLPLVLPSDSPIFYLGLGLPRVGYNMVSRLLKEGFYTNIGIFPGVPVKCCGLRLAVTNGQTKEDIKNVLDAYQYHFPKVLEEEGQTVEDISVNFNLPFEETKKRYLQTVPTVEDLFDIQHETTIHKIDKQLWDDLLGDNGTFDWEGCRFIEETFRDNPEPENNWKLHYVIIKDKEKQQPILATYFTELLCKDDMIAPEGRSSEIEEIRKYDKYYLTSNVVMMGSLLSEGDHLFIDRNYPFWRDSVIEVIRIMNEVKVAGEASAIQLRDLNTSDSEIRNLLLKEGFARASMPDTHIIVQPRFDSVDKFLAAISHKSRKHVRKFMISKEMSFQVNFEGGVSSEIDQYYDLYLNVKRKSYTINTFDLPKVVFANAMKSPNWEILNLYIPSVHKLVGFVLSYKSSRGNYCPVIIGMDYNYNDEFSIYRQALFQLVKRASIGKASKIYLGMDATVEKQKVGTQVVPKSVYIQADDNFNMELIESVIQGKI